MAVPFVQLYTISINNQPERRDLYMKSHEAEIIDGVVTLSRAQSKADFLTYFNAFSVSKWKRYTTLSKLKLIINVRGKCKIKFKGLDANGTKILGEDIINVPQYEREFLLRDLNCDILGFEIHNLGESCTFIGGFYAGEFASWRPVKIGVALCTFKREKYAQRNIITLKNFAYKNSWLSTIVVDNGSTLTEKNVSGLRILHNINLGGSGGFTRGIIETMQQNIFKYVLLMDDDIDIDMTAVERMHSLLCGLRENYRDSFIAGAMLAIDQPTVQYERCAYWSHIHLKSVGHGLDLTKAKNIFINEIIAQRRNMYGGWWFSCMPLQRIEQIGYPLPLFIKGDDIEYGIRNEREFITLNGINVWHVSFSKKNSYEVNYFSDRNMLIVNNFAHGCGALTFSAAILLRLLKRLFLLDKRALEMYYCAINDYIGGFEKITCERQEEKIGKLRNFKSNKNVIVVFFMAIERAFYAIRNYDFIHEQYIIFRNSNLMDAKFWVQLLQLDIHFE